MTHCSYQPQVRGVGEEAFTGNALRFATAEEAINYCINLQSRWMGCKGGAENRRALECDEPATHRWLQGRGLFAIGEVGTDEL